MPIHLRLTAAVGSSFSVGIEMLAATPQFYDFGNGTFTSGTPSTPFSNMTPGTGNYAGMYSFDMSSTPAGTFPDGDYNFTIHNTASSNVVVGNYISTCTNGDFSGITYNNINTNLGNVSLVSTKAPTVMGAWAGSWVSAFGKAQEVSGTPPILQVFDWTTTVIATFDLDVLPLPTVRTPA